MNQTPNLIVFTLSFKRDDTLLSHAPVWIDELSLYFNEINVFATHSSRDIQVPEKITVYELGSGKRLVRLASATLCSFHLARILLTRGKCFVFYHMNHKPAVFLGPIFRIFGIEQTLWYSHQKKTKSLVLASIFVNRIATPTLSSFPIASKKVHALGHTFTSNPKGKIMYIDFEHKLRIVHLGRIAPVKRIEVLIEHLTKYKSILNEVDLHGPVLNKDYAKKLECFAYERNIKLNFKGSYKHSELSGILEDRPLVFVGTLGSIDKVAIEAATMGCVLTSDNIDLLMEMYSETIVKRHDLQVFHTQDIYEQVKSIIGKNKKDLFQLQSDLQLQSIEKFNPRSFFLKLAGLVKDES